MKLKCFLILLSCFCAKSFALPWDTKIKTNIPFRSEPNSKVTQQKVERIFAFFEESNVNRKLLSRNVLSEFFSENVVYKINGVTISTDIEGLTERWNRVSSFLKSYNLKKPLTVVVIANNLASVSYEFNEQRIDGTSFHNVASVMITYNGKKISKWEAVIEHTK